MESQITREAAWELLRKYNKDPFHLQHALTVEGVMRWYAGQLGFADEVDFWGQVGLLHDIDFELYPEKHCIKAPEREARTPDGEGAIRYRRTDGTDMGSRIDAPLEECPGHGAEVPEEKIQVERLCSRLFPRGD